MNEDRRGANSFVVVPITTTPFETQTLRYDIFVASLFKADSYREMLFHAILGVNEEAGEAATEIKRHLVYGQKLNREALIKELGDLRFFIQAVQNILEISEQEILQCNAYKLAQRYSELVYTPEAAQERKDEKKD